MRLSFTQHKFHALAFELLLVKLAHKHEIRDIGDDVKRIGDTALPHLLPNGVNLIFSRSGDHVESFRIVRMRD